jgi:hypothetical protein
MKITMKKNKNSNKIILKNGYRFSLMLLNSKKDFITDLIELLDKWPSHYRETPLGHTSEYEYQDMNKNNELAFSQRIEFLNSLKKEGKFWDFYKDIDDFLKKYDFGYEWLNTIIDYVISLWLLPPLHNLDIQNSNKRILLTLNPDTSLNDIREAWPRIKKEQKKLWPNFKIINFTKKSLKNLEIAISDIKKRGLKEATIDDNDLTKYILTDLDIASRIWEKEKDISAKADKKRVQNLRQIRSRHMHKLP